MFSFLSKIVVGLFATIGAIFGFQDKNIAVITPNLTPVQIVSESPIVSPTITPTLLVSVKPSKTPKISAVTPRPSTSPTTPPPVFTPTPSLSPTPSLTITPTPVCHWWQWGCSETPPPTPTPQIVYVTPTPTPSTIIPPTPTPTSTLIPTLASTPTSTPTPTFTPSPVPPSIFNIQIKNILPTSVSIHWTTDKPTATDLEYSTQSNLDNRTIKHVSYPGTYNYPGTDYDEIVSYLKPEATYYFRIIARGQDGGESFSEIKNFTTTKAGQLIVALSPDNPPQTIKSDSKNIDVLKLKLEALNEDIEVNKMVVILENANYKGHDDGIIFSSLKIVEEGGGILGEVGGFSPGTGRTAIFNNPLLINVGTSKTITFKVDFTGCGFQCVKNIEFGLNYSDFGLPYWGSQGEYLGKYSIGAVGMLSKMAIFTNASSPLVGNVITITD